MKKVKTGPTIAKARNVSTGSAKSIQRILVVDDVPFFCHRSAEVLIRHGFAVNAAGASAGGGMKSLPAPPSPVTG